MPLPAATPKIIVTGLFLAPGRVAHFAAGGIFVGLAKGCLFLRRDLQYAAPSNGLADASQPLAVSQNRGRGFSLSRRVRPAGVNPICRSDVYCVIVTIEWYVLLEPLVAHRHSAAGGFSLVLLVRRGCQVCFILLAFRAITYNLVSALEDPEKPSAPLAVQQNRGRGYFVVSAWLLLSSRCIPMAGF